MPTFPSFLPQDFHSLLGRGFLYLLPPCLTLQSFLLIFWMLVFSLMLFYVFFTSCLWNLMKEAMMLMFYFIYFHWFYLVSEDSWWIFVLVLVKGEELYVYVNVGAIGIRGMETVCISYPIEPMCFKLKFLYIVFNTFMSLPIKFRDMCKFAKNLVYLYMKLMNWIFILFLFLIFSPLILFCA